MENYDYQNYAINQNENSPKPDKKGKKLYDISTIKELIVFLLGWIGLNLVATLIQIILLSFVKIPDKDLYPEEYLKFATNFSGYINFATYALITISILCVLGIPFLKKLGRDFKNAEKIAKGILYGVIMMGATIAYNVILQVVYPPISDNVNEQTVGNVVKALPVLSFFFVVILGPLCEECTYRLSLFGLLYKKNKYLAFIVTTLLFGLIHSVFFSDSVFTLTSQQLINELLNLPSYMISGFILCLAYYNEESLVTSLTAHIFNNLIAYVENLLVSGVVIHGFIK